MHVCRPLGAGGAAPPENFQGVLSPPAKIFVMLFYINNDDKLCFFDAACIFISFIASMSRYFSLQMKILNSSNGIYASCKGSTKLAYIHLTSRAFGQCPVGRCRIVKYGPAAMLK